MIHHIQGKLYDISPTSAVLENQGIGYILQISLKTYEQIKDAKEATLFVHTLFREDSQTMYGFFWKQERICFEMLMLVSGVGPSASRLIVSEMEPLQVVRSILNQEVEAFKRVKGIGAKTAQRILVDLKDKALLLFPEVQSLDPLDSLPEGEKYPSASMKQEALSALFVLGYQQNKSSKVLDAILKDTAVENVETLIKLALAKMQ